MASLFTKLFRKNHAEAEEVKKDIPQMERKDIAEDLFSEKKLIIDDDFKSNSNGILAIYHFLQSDFEKQGFDDSMISPDDSYKNENMRLIRYDLEIIINKVRIYHDSLLKEIDFHISSRSRAGLVDLVEELKSKRTDLLEHVSKVNEIEKEMNSKQGYCERAILSYNRGFMKGMASITQASLLSKPF